MKEFKLQLNFPSFLKISMIIGACMGIGFAPIVAVLNFGQLGMDIIPIALLATPFFGLVNGFLGGLVGFPVYFWLSKRIGFRFKGHLYLAEAQGA